MDNTERLEHLIAHSMATKILRPEALSAEQSELTRSVLMAVGKAALAGDAAAARLLIELGVLKMI